MSKIFYFNFTDVMPVLSNVSMENLQEIKVVLSSELEQIVSLKVFYVSLRLVWCKFFTSLEVFANKGSHKQARISPDFSRVGMCM